MFLSMGVGLYTSRVILNTLGVEDFGVYNIVGSIVTLFGFFNSAMSSATQRFLSFDIGKGDDVQLSKTFNATLTIHYLIAIIVLILAETIGLWFLNYKLNIPAERMEAANWVYQFSVLTFLFGIIQVPYNALIIAHERMNIYAYVSIFEVVAKLVVVYLLLFIDFDKLMLYAVLLFVVAFLVRMIEKWYCKKHFRESKYQFEYDKDYFKKLMSYSGWNLFGNIAAIARSQGNNILLNLMYGTVLNAAYGITSQLQQTVLSFVNNFQMALNPQIIKKYASGEKVSSIKLMMQSSKFSFYLMFLLVFPILMNTKYVLELWLKNLPTYTVEFVQLSLIAVLIDTLSNPLMTGLQATGEIKRYQMIVGGLLFMNLPISYVLLTLYNSAQLIYVTMIVISFVALFFRLYFLHKTMKFSFVGYLNEVILRIIGIVGINVFISLFCIKNFVFSNNLLTNFLLESLFCLIIIVSSVSVLGFNKSEKNLVLTFLSNRFFKIGK